MVPLGINPVDCYAIGKRGILAAPDWSGLHPTPNVPFQLIWAQNPYEHALQTGSSKNKHWFFLFHGSSYHSLSIHNHKNASLLMECGVWHGLGIFSRIPDCQSDPVSLLSPYFLSPSDSSICPIGNLSGQPQHLLSKFVCPIQLTVSLSTGLCKRSLQGFNFLFLGSCWFS